MSRTYKDRPWRIRLAEGGRIRSCPGCPWCGVGAEAKQQARKDRRREGKRECLSER